MPLAELVDVFHVKKTGAEDVMLLLTGETSDGTVGGAKSSLLKLQDLFSVFPDGSWIVTVAVMTVKGLKGSGGSAVTLHPSFVE